MGHSFYELEYQNQVIKSSNKPVKLRIPNDDKSFSCNEAALNFVAVHLCTRPDVQFSFTMTSSLTRDQLSAILSKAIVYLRLLQRHFKSHSLRIGRPTDLAVMGLANAAIQQIGRWHSDACKF